MNDAQIQRELNQLVKICNELVDETHRRYGIKGNLYFESEGTFYLMSGDPASDRGREERQSHIEFSSDGFCRLGSGAW